MTQTTTATSSSSGQPVPAGPEPSGTDLARVALHAARQAAKQRGATEHRTPRRRPRRAARRDGRDPQNFAAVLTTLMADQGWDLPAAGGTVLDRWPDIAAAVAPHLPDHVQAVTFHAETGRLDLRPNSPAWATQLRLITSRIITAANEAAGTEAVRTVRVLPPGSAIPTPRTDDTAPTPAPATAAPPEEPAEAREASAGYRAARAAYQAVRPERRVDPAIAAAAERQTKALLEQRDTAFPDGQAAMEQPHNRARRTTASVDASRARALRRLAAERAGRLDAHVPHRLGRTA